jgi:hypothetical protein
MTGSKSLRIVGVASKLGSMIEVKRIPGRYFETSEQAEQHGSNLPSSGLMIMRRTDRLNSDNGRLISKPNQV